MDTKPTAVSRSGGLSDFQGDSLPPAPRRVWHNVRGRILGGLLFVLPILITCWVIYWLYSLLENYLIGPFARLVLWKAEQHLPDTTLPYWFETYAAPVLGVLLALVLLYALGFFVQTRLRRMLDWFLLRVPVISAVYKSVRQVFHTLERQGGQRQRPQRVVLVAFPHPGMKVPAFVTSTCRDIDTQKILLCVYVPTTPVPTSGYFLLVPEEEVTELNWSSEQALQAIISAGLTAPSEVRYFKTGLAPESPPAALRFTGQPPPHTLDDRPSPAG